MRQTDATVKVRRSEDRQVLAAVASGVASDCREATGIQDVLLDPLLHLCQRGSCTVVGPSLLNRTPLIQGPVGKGQCRLIAPPISPLTSAVHILA